MSNEESDSFKAKMAVYNSKCFLVKDLYWNRIKTSIEFAKITDENVVLDIGCNEGYLLEEIRNQNKNCECWGTDIEPNIVSLKIENCKFRVADVKNLPFKDDYFDIIFALSTLEHIKNLDTAIKEIKRVLKPKGFVIMSSPTESRFYRMCRFFLYGSVEKNVKKNKPGFMGEADHHFQNVFDIEKKFHEFGFRQIQEKSLPGFPIPALHRVTKFQK